MSWGCLSISAISQLLLTRFGSNLKQRVLGTYTTDYNCHHDICPGNICPHQQHKYFQAEHIRLQSCLAYFSQPDFCTNILLSTMKLINETIFFWLIKECRSNCRPKSRQDQYNHFFPHLTFTYLYIKNVPTN